MISTLPVLAAETGLPASTEKALVKAVRRWNWVVAAALLALILKLFIAWKTFGTNDVITFFQFGEFLTQHDLETAYRTSIAFNHPPLVAYSLKLIFQISQQPLFASGVWFPFLLRLPGILADFISVLVLLRIAKENPKMRLPNWALILFALSPVSLMVSGFHGNTDGVMVMLLLLAAYACTRDNPIFCGLFLALSCQIKIIPLLLLPIFFFYWWQRRISFRFLIPFAAASLILWSEPLLGFPAPFLKNVLAYGSFWGLWGITYFLRLTGWHPFGKVTYYNFTSAEMVAATVLKLLIIVCVLAIAWRRRALPATALLGSLAYAWIVFFVFSPGVCAQYMVWLAPFVLLRSPLLYGYVELGSSLFLFFFYNTIADAFPWFIAISKAKQRDWVPWSLWPWAILIGGLILLWRNARHLDPSLRLFGLKQVRHSPLFDGR
jgi:hypothetical protein